LRKVVPSSLRRATRIAVPTHFVGTTLTKYFATDSSRIDVVRHGLEEHTGTNATPASVVREKFNLGHRQVLVFPAITHPHKNHRFILEMMTTPGSIWNDDNLVVVFAGGQGRAASDVDEMVNDLNLTHRVVRPGRVSADDRDGLLMAAEAMVFPSEYEGFGAPLVESMRLGTPFIASDRASIPEVAGDAGIIAPLTFNAWNQALADIRTRRTEIVSAGHARAEVFTSIKSAHDLVECYEKALS
jgi:glycosyltransferase involved in cell wall biosynthesis